jgi:hypothetical protein
MHIVYKCIYDKWPRLLRITEQLSRQGRRQNTCETINVKALDQSLFMSPKNSSIPKRNDLTKTVSHNVIWIWIDRVLQNVRIFVFMTAFLPDNSTLILEQSAFISTTANWAVSAGTFCIQTLHKNLQHCGNLLPFISWVRSWNKIPAGVTSC